MRYFGSRYWQSQCIQFNDAEFVCEAITIAVIHFLASDALVIPAAFSIRTIGDKIVLHLDLGDSGAPVLHICLLKLSNLPSLRSDIAGMRVRTGAREPLAPAMFAG